MSSQSFQPMNSDVAVWDAIAAEYAQWLIGDRDIRGKAFTTIVTDNVLEIAGNVQGKDILDLGCGEGYLSRELMRRGASICGIDAAPSMINMAREADREHSARYVVGDITAELPYERDRFDLVISNMVFMDVENVAEPIEQATRVLKPHGKLIFSVVHPCFFHALGEWLDTSTPHPALRFKARYTEQIVYRKRLPGLASDVLVNHYNRPIQDYIRPLIENGLCISDFRETSFTREYLDSIGYTQAFLRYHLSANNLIVGASKMGS